MAAPKHEKLKQLVKRSHELIEGAIDRAVAEGCGAHWGEIGVVVIDAATPDGKLIAEWFGDVEWTEDGDVAVSPGFVSGVSDGR